MWVSHLTFYAGRFAGFVVPTSTAHSIWPVQVLPKQEAATATRVRCTQFPLLASTCQESPPPTLLPEEIRLVWTHLPVHDCHVERILFTISLLVLKPLSGMHVS